MHSWIFRNRERLRILFGLDLPNPPAPILSEFQEASARDASEESSRPKKSTLKSPRAAKAGTIRRTSRHVILQPMPPQGLAS